MHLDPQSFLQVETQVDLRSAYSALHLSRCTDRELHAELLSRMERNAWQSDPSGFVQMALSGMEDAILPFHRAREDIYFAAAFVTWGSNFNFKGIGNAVDAGYFTWSGGHIRYTDVVGRGYPLVRELLNPVETLTHLNTLWAWQQHGHWPRAIAGDIERGELLRIAPGTSAGVPGAADRHPRLMARYLQSEIRLLRVIDEGPQHGPNGHLSVQAVATGSAPLQPQDGELVLRDPAPELVMELHAALMAAQDQGHELWLLVRRFGNCFLSRLPDLLTPGSTARGWWTPPAHFTPLDFRADDPCLSVPRWAAARMMQNYPWASTKSEEEWARLAFWLEAGHSKGVQA